MARFTPNSQILRNTVILFWLLIAGLSGGDIQAQYSTTSKKAIKSFQQGLYFFQINQINEAQSFTEQAIKADPNFIEALSLMGDIKARVKEYDEAKQYYLRIVSIDEYAYPKGYYYLAYIAQQAGEYEESYRYINTFLSFKEQPKSMTEKALELKQSVDFARVAIANPVPFKPENLGPGVNSEHKEFHPSLSLDLSKLIFTREEPVGVAENGRTVSREDFYQSTYTNDSWAKAKNMGAPLNTRENEGAQSLSHDGKWLFFTACHREDGKGKCDIYLSEKNGESWSKGINLGEPINTGNWEAHPSFSPDGKTLYFSSNRSGTKGGADIWSIELQNDGTWGNLTNLPFNTDKDEFSPFIHADGKTLFFASKGLPGFGGFDLFKVEITNGNYGPAQNLGYPINTQGDEHGIIVERSGKYAYYSSDRDSGFGQLDLYRFLLPEVHQVQSVGLAKGKVIDAETKAPLRADFELIDVASAQSMVKSRTDAATGEFLVPLPIDKNFVINVSSTGYLFYSSSVHLTKYDTETPQMLVIELNPLKVGKRIVMNNIFFETGSFTLSKSSDSELKKLLDFMRNNPSIKVEISGHTDNVGNANDNVVLSENRAKSVHEYLINKGIEAQRISFKGYGDKEPIDTNDTPEGRAKNRRTELKIIGE